MATVTLKLKQPINVSLQAKEAGSNAYDVIYFVRIDANGKQASDVKKLGDCIAISKSKEYFSITVDVEDTGVETPVANDYIFFAKNSIIQSNGVSGYFAEVEMRNDSRSEVELYAVSSNIVESSK